MSRILQAEEIEKVHPFFRDMVQKAFEQEESVPYEVTLLSYETPTDVDIQWAIGAIAKHQNNLRVAE